MDELERVAQTKSNTRTQDAEKGEREEERDEPFGKAKRAVCRLMNRTF